MYRCFMIDILVRKVVKADLLSTAVSGSHQNAAPLIRCCCRKPKKHSSKKSREGNGTIQEEEEEEEQHVSSPSKKKSAPVRFYIDEEHDVQGSEKEHLMTAPEIVVDPPSDSGAGNRV